MDGAGDIAGIGIPFAAGVAAGSILFPCLTPLHQFIPASLVVSVYAFALAALARMGSRTGKIRIRLCFGILFALAGLFCALNSNMTAGIPGGAGPFLRLPSRCYDSLRAGIDSIPFPSESSAPLVKALLSGDRGGLDRHTIQVFRDSGASHILALSGLHLGIIYLILSKLLAPVGRSPAAHKVRYSLILGFSGFYVLMTGASPSIVRAFLFIVLGETANLLGRSRDPSRILLAALTLQLMFKPEVISSAGFQLSYLAMAGIYFVYPRLERIYPSDGPRIDPFRRIWQAAMLSISCQLFTAPLSWHLFHSFPEYFLLTNMVALPLTSAVMVLSVTTIALSFIGACPYFLVWLDDLALGLLVRSLETISSL